jgi:hypothetical protein
VGDNNKRRVAYQLKGGGKFDQAAPEDSARRNSLSGGKLPAFEETP